MSWISDFFSQNKGIKTNSKWKAACPLFIPAFAMFYLCKTTINVIKLASTLVALSCSTSDKRNKETQVSFTLNKWKMKLKLFWKHPVSLILDKEYIIGFQVQWNVLWTKKNNPGFKCAWLMMHTQHGKITHWKIILKISTKHKENAYT